MTDRSKKSDNKDLVAMIQLNLDNQPSDSESKSIMANEISKEDIKMNNYGGTF